MEAAVVLLGLSQAGGGKGGVLPLVAWREQGPAQALVLDFELPELRDNKFLLF